MNIELKYFIKKSTPVVVVEGIDTKLYLVVRLQFCCSKEYLFIAITLGPNKTSPLFSPLLFSLLSSFLSSFLSSPLFSSMGPTELFKHLTVCKQMTDVELLVFHSKTVCKQTELWLV